MNIVLSLVVCFCTVFVWVGVLNLRDKSLAQKPKCLKHLDCRGRVCCKPKKLQ